MSCETIRLERTAPRPFEAVARLALRAPRRVLAVAALLAVAAAIFGVPVAKSLCACGFDDPSSESARAQSILTQKFGAGDATMVIVVSAADGAGGTAARAAGTRLVADLSSAPHVTSVTSPWTAPPAQRPSLVSADGRSGLVVVGIAGAENETQGFTKDLTDRYVRDGGRRHDARRR